MTYEDCRIFVGKDVALCYGREFSDEEMLKVFATGKDFVTDAQNLTPKRMDLIKEYKYALRVQCYNMTGLVDLMQYYFTKIK